MDYLPNGTLQDVVKNYQKGEMPEEEARNLFRQLVQALFYIHEVKGLAHRDIKTDNIMLNEKNELKLVDFGVSTFFQGNND